MGVDFSPTLRQHDIKNLTKTVIPRSNCSNLHNQPKHCDFYFEELDFYDRKHR